jgi:hypothetical protein
VNGQGARRSLHGARYNYPGVVSVYLAEDVETCLAEKAFYFQREYLQKLDDTHLQPSPLPPRPTTDAVLWSIEFSSPVPDIAQLDEATASSFGVFPCMMTNPSQDYRHLKQQRAALENQFYKGLLAPSSRSTNGGRMFVLFDDQSTNVASIQPHAVEFRLTTTSGSQFQQHHSQKLDFEGVDIRIKPIAPSTTLPSWARPYVTWTHVRFHH